MFGNYGTKSTPKKDEPKYKVEKDFGVLSSREHRGTTYEKRLRLVDWNERGVKFDIREWWYDEDGNECCGKGITLTSDEVCALYNILDGIKEE